MISLYKAGTEFYTDERCHVTELHNRPEDAGCSIAFARVEPGVITQRHTLRGTDERYLILEGEGLVMVGDMEAASVRKGDVVFIAADTVQSIENTGMTDLLFACICTPRFEPDCYAPAEIA